MRKKCLQLVKDKYGVSWQTEKSERVMKAMLQMDKIDIKTLEEAYEKQ